MNIHLPAILMFTRGTRFWHTAICYDCYDMLASETLNLDPAKFAKREACRKCCIGHGLVFTSTRAGGKVKDDIVKGSGSTVLGAALFVFNGGTAPDAAAEEFKQFASAWMEWLCHWDPLSWTLQLADDQVPSCSIMFHHVPSFHIFFHELS